MKKTPQSHLKTVTPAKIEWNEQTPVSSHYDDIYFSRDDGVAETEYVFLKQNSLPDAWQNKESFTVLETGFGTGLNFFCTLDMWFKTADENACLTYISVEKYPLSKSELQRQKQIWPQFSDFIEQLIQNYPPMLSGLHSCSLFSGRVRLLLLFGDATEQLSTLIAQADVCFLDGFAPSKNQSMWTIDLFMQLARLVKPGGTVSTFTAVGDVRRGLQQAGFEMKKADAFGKKRHMLVGTLRQPSSQKLLMPWFQYPAYKVDKKQALVIGAGIAGLTTAIALLEAGWKVTILEQSSSVASAASGNRAGVVMPRLDKQQSTDARFYWQAFFSALRKIEQYEATGLETGWQQTGVLQLVDDASSYLSDWPESLFTEVKQAAAKTLTGVEVSSDALWLKQAGFIRPAIFCENLFNKYKHQIEFVFDTQVTALQKAATDWQVQTSEGVFTAQTVIICNAEAASQFEQTRSMSLQAVRGQVSYLESSLAHRLKTVICDKGYAIPVDQQLLIGATFSRDELGRELRDEDHEYNLKQFNKSLGDSEPLSNKGDIAIDIPVAGRASIRAMTPDRL
ncbi:MAG: bifunctional tRNA (5-methylaminomethyl-2-thiouridine)(34)-methyltransferase MnmD/FAD-dependent 5-carboxymethylaminomethyl-2-thiouridine(34) oxidoreductase MnmC, partial [Gammaproteobacteria bacterium]|nr:bifunctional tRNA (5-methylaminomethyl-2-thiouridine)(34)-methyltransferase MnmD/FAD-dependent 5-carboxymethylaminomethyl-2-thiouridine(34) oxidoreductase MnmC [Gammaproteobacteria bacterium]